jgi:hypothetical protein
MSKENITIRQSGSGIGFFSLLAIVFITLKLMGLTAVASWSWWWVLAPLWLPITIVLGILLITFAITILVLLFVTTKRK